MKRILEDVMKWRRNFSITATAWIRRSWYTACSQHNVSENSKSMLGCSSPEVKVFRAIFHRNVEFLDRSYFLSPEHLQRDGKFKELRHEDERKWIKQRKFPDSNCGQNLNRHVEYQYSNNWLKGHAWGTWKEEIQNKNPLKVYNGLTFKALGLMS